MDSILTFFDSEVISQTPSSEIIQSYQELFQILKDSINSDSPSIALRLDFQKLELLLSELPESLKTEIWYEAYAIESLTNDSTKYIDIRHDGIYADFLQSVSQKNEFIDEYYYDDLQHAFAITPGMNANMIVNPNKLDIRKERERLIFAIHFISLQKLSRFNN